MSSPAVEGPAPTRRLAPGERPGARLFGPYVILGRGEPEPDQPCLAFRADRNGGRLCRLVLGRTFTNEDERARWRAWAEKLLALDHPNLVKIWAVGEHDGVPFVEEELVEGRELAALVRNLAERQTPMRNPVALLIARDVAETLAHAFSGGVAHGDLDARRILVTYEGEVKVRGWHFRVAPASAAQASADLQRLCVLLWELLSHRPAPRNDLAPAAWPKPSQFNADVPPAVDKLMAAALAKGESGEVVAEDLARDLDRILIVSTRAHDELTRLMHSLPKAASTAEQAALAAEIAPWLSGPAGASSARRTPTASTVRLPLAGTAVPAQQEPAPRHAAATDANATTSPDAATGDDEGEERARRRRTILVAGGLGVVFAAASVAIVAAFQATPARTHAIANAGTVPSHDEAASSQGRASPPGSIAQERAAPPAASIVSPTSGSSRPTPTPVSEAAAGTAPATRVPAPPVIESLPSMDQGLPAQAAASGRPRRRHGSTAHTRGRETPGDAARPATTPATTPEASEVVGLTLARGRRALSEGHADAAIAAAREAIEASTSTTTAGAAHSLLGQAYFAKGAYPAAAAELRRAIALDPGDSRATRRLRWLEASGNTPPAPASSPGAPGAAALAP